MLFFVSFDDWDLEIVMEGRQVVGLANYKQYKSREYCGEHATYIETQACLQFTVIQQLKMSAINNLLRLLSTLQALYCIQDNKLCMYMLRKTNQVKMKTVALIVQTKPMSLEIQKLQEVFLAPLPPSPSTKYLT